MKDHLTAISVWNAPVAKFARVPGSEPESARPGSEGGLSVGASAQCGKGSLLDGRIRVSGHNQVPKRKNWTRLGAIDPLTSARRFLLAALLISFTGAPSDAQVSDANVLRGMAQAERDAGRVSRFHLVKLYGAIGVTMAPPATRATREVEAEIARKWAQEFCASASRDRHWDRRWKVIVYAYGQAQRSSACVIPLRQGASKVSVPGQNSESRTTLDDDGRLLPEPGEQIE
jgi:hypothetical protein